MAQHGLIMPSLRHRWATWDCLPRQGKLEEALEARTALEISKVLGLKHPDVRRTATVCLPARQAGAGAKAHAGAGDLAQGAGPDHCDVAASYNNLECLRSQGKLEEAQKAPARRWRSAQGAGAGASRRCKVVQQLRVFTKARASWRRRRRRSARRWRSSSRCWAVDHPALQVSCCKT